MKDTFKQKYRDYCKYRETKDEFSRMMQGENESLQDYERIFQLSYKWAHNSTMNEEYFKLVLLRGVSKELLETVNLLSNGEIYQLDYDEIK